MNAEDINFSFSQRFCWGLSSSGIWHCVLGWVVRDVSKDHTGFILRVKHSWTADEGTAILRTDRNYSPTIERNISEDLN